MPFWYFSGISINVTVDKKLCLVSSEFNEQPTDGDAQLTGTQLGWRNANFGI